MRSCSIVCEKLWKASAASYATVDRSNVNRSAVIRAGRRKTNVCGARDRDLFLSVLFGVQRAVDRGLLHVAAGMVLPAAVSGTAWCRSYVRAAAASVSGLRGDHLGADSAFVCIARAPRHHRTAGRRPVGLRT